MGTSVAAPAVVERVVCLVLAEAEVLVAREVEPVAREPKPLITIVLTSGSTMLTGIILFVVVLSTPQDSV
jgi:hypothetical protein